MKLLKRDIITKCFVGVKDDERLSVALGFIFAFIKENNLKSLSENEEVIVTELLNVLRYKFSSKYAKARTWEKFEKNHHDFLSNHFEFNFDADPNTPKLATRPLAPKKKTFRSKGRTSKWKIVKELTKNLEYDSWAFLEAALVASNREKNFSRASSIKKILKKKKGVVEKAVKVADHSDSFEFFVVNNFSQRQYKNVKRFFDTRNARILPTYDTLLMMKKNCYPQGIIVTELEAYVPLQNFFEHVVLRLLKCFGEEFYSMLNETQTHENLTIEFLYGFDGSSGFSHFNMAIESDRSDENLFAVACIPLRISTSQGMILWKNPSTASPRMCLPLHLIFAKETKTLTKQIDANLKAEIANLKPIENLPLTCDETMMVSFQAKFYLALVDGKVVADLRDIGYASCSFCKSKPSEFNDITIWNKQEKKIESSLFTGISPLHAKIRFFEHLLNIGYKKVTKNARSGTHEVVKNNKIVIQDRFHQLMNLKVDKPNPKGGNSNSGNVARSAFQNPDLFAECVGFDAGEKEVIVKLSYVLLCITCKLEIDPEKFKAFCFETHKLYIKYFNWYPMSATLHKVLFHGHEFMKHFTIPIGELTEEASESKNKFYRKDRLEHARQSSRIANTTDMFHRSYCMGDPYFSSKALSKLKAKSKPTPLPPEVVDMLKHPPDNDDVIDILNFEDEDDCILENEDIN
jgi:hypothetical protein